MDDHGQPAPDPALAAGPPGIPWYLQRPQWGPEDAVLSSLGQNSRAGIHPALLLFQVSRKEANFWPERCLEGRCLFGAGQWARRGSCRCFMGLPITGTAAGER